MYALVDEASKTLAAHLMETMDNYKNKIKPLQL